MKLIVFALGTLFCFSCHCFGGELLLNGEWRLLESGHGTSYNLKNLKPGQEYKVAVIAMFNGEWKRDYSKAITVTPRDEEYPTLSNIEYSRQFHQFKLEWNEVQDAEEYGVAVKIAGRWKILAYTNELSYTSPLYVVYPFMIISS